MHQTIYTTQKWLGAFYPMQLTMPGLPPPEAVISEACSKAIAVPDQGSPLLIVTHWESIEELWAEGAWWAECIRLGTNLR